MLQGRVLHIHPPSHISHFTSDTIEGISHGSRGLANMLLKILLCFSIFSKILCQTASCEGHFTSMALLEYISQAV